MDKETLSNYGWIVICVLVLAVMLALATPFGQFISDAVWNTANGLFNTNESALDAGINGILGKEKIEVDGLGKITVQNPYDAEFEYDEETGILIGKTPITPIDPEELENAIPMIEFTAGTFESNTEYTPGQYELESYEVTKTRTKKPVACKGGIIISCTYVGEGTFQDNQPTPDYVDHASTYIAYCVARSGDTTVNGFVPFHLNYRTIANAADDTLENAIYIAAFTQKGTNINWNVAKWNGSKYVDVNCRAEIDAITDFTEAYTETLSRPVTITKPSNSTSLVYLPSGTMNAEAGMTWSEWLSSDYNTFGAKATKVWDANYNEVSLDSEIIAGGKYGFSVVKKESKWPITWNMAEITNNTSVYADGINIYKASDIVPSESKMLSAALTAQNINIVCMPYFTEENISVFMCADETETNMLALFVVSKENAISENLGGIVFPETGIYIADITGNLQGQNIDVTIDTMSISYTETISDSWSDIKAHIDAGDYKSRYKLGDTKVVQCADGYAILMEIVAFDEDTKADGTKAAITWMSKYTIQTRCMNPTGTVEGGWEKTELRKWLQGDFYSILPNEVKKNIATVQKTFFDMISKTTLQCNDTLWIPSCHEMFGPEYSGYNEDIGADYTEYFKDDNSRIKLLNGCYLAPYWLRSATGFTQGKGFEFIDTDGDDSPANSATRPDDVMPMVIGFCM